jgi:glycosyltransferase involved in cell wall biosynthesis
LNAANRPLRVLHCVAGNLHGGVETFLKNLADCRDVCPGLAQEFAVCFEGRLADELKASGAAVHRIGAVRFSRPWTVWRARRRLAGLLERQHIDLVLTHGCWPHLLCGPVAQSAGRPVAFWAHDPIAEPSSWIWIERGASRCVPALVLAHNRVTAATVPRLHPGVPIGIVRPVVRPVAVDRAEARAGVRSGTQTPEEDAVIVMAARLEIWKGHRLLLDALTRLRGKAGWTAWIAGGVQRPGERPYWDDLQQHARAGGIADRVRWLGQRGDVPRLLAAADVHCQPNVAPEPFGIAFIEALHAALPVVTTRIGGAVEIVDETCGRLTPPDDPAALAATLATLIDDPDLRARLGSAGPARAASLCAPGSVLPILERLLIEAASR